MGIINFLWWPWLGRRRVGAAGFTWFFDIVNNIFTCT
jgi:hypothetical protein